MLKFGVHTQRLKKNENNNITNERQNIDGLTQLIFVIYKSSFLVYSILFNKKNDFLR